jgi:hypothetical protein
VIIPGAIMHKLILLACLIASPAIAAEPEYGHASQATMEYRTRHQADYCQIVNVQLIRGYNAIAALQGGGEAVRIEQLTTTRYETEMNFACHAVFSLANGIHTPGVISARMGADSAPSISFHPDR